MECLLKRLRDQGISLETAMELVERKRKSPSLCGVTVRGQWVSLDPPTDGQKFNQMVSAGQPPNMTGTDLAFLEGTENGRQFQREPQIGNRYLKELRKHGVKDLHGKVYKASLARFPGDPRACVSDLGEARRVIAAREEEAKKHFDEEPKVVPINPKIVARETAIELAGQTVTGKEYKEVREKVRQRITPKHKRK